MAASFTFFRMNFFVGKNDHALSSPSFDVVGSTQLSVALRVIGEVYSTPFPVLEVVVQASNSQYGPSWDDVLTLIYDPGAPVPLQHEAVSLTKRYVRAHAKLLAVVELERIGFTFGFWGVARP